MISGERCESLELDEEDRRRIEEIKRELLLKKPMKVDEVLPSHIHTRVAACCVFNIVVFLMSAQRRAGS